MFGQLVIGPPGSGKTTYCQGMAEFMKAIGRPVAIVNLDPANEGVPYEATVDLGELVCLETVMDELQLGPNGGLVYCMEYLAQHLAWLHGKLAALSSDTYLIFDCPGQVELYTHTSGMKTIVETLTRKWQVRLAAVHLVDSHYCADPHKFVSVVLVSLATMVQLELPHVNVLSKVDLIESVGRLSFGLEFYVNAEELHRLLPGGADSADSGGDAPAAAKAVSATPAGDALERRYQALTGALTELIESFSLVRFTTLNISDKGSVHALLSLLDKTNGYMYAGMQSDVLGVAFSDLRTDSERVGEVQDRYMSELV